MFFLPSAWDFRGGGERKRGDATPARNVQCLSTMVQWHPDRHTSATSPALVRDDQICATLAWQYGGGAVRREQSVPLPVPSLWVTPHTSLAPKPIHDKPIRLNFPYFPFKKTKMLLVVVFGQRKRCHSLQLQRNACHTPVRHVRFSYACQTKSFLWSSVRVLLAVLLSSPQSFGHCIPWPPSWCTTHLWPHWWKARGEPAAKTNLHACVFRRVWLSAWVTVGLGGEEWEEEWPCAGDRFLGNAPPEKRKMRKTQSPRKNGKNGTEKTEKTENSENSEQKHQICFEKRSRHSKKRNSAEILQKLYGKAVLKLRSFPT